MTRWEVWHLLLLLWNWEEYFWDIWNSHSARLVVFLVQFRPQYLKVGLNKILLIPINSRPKHQWDDMHWTADPGLMTRQCCRVDKMVGILWPPVLAQKNKQHHIFSEKNINFYLMSSNTPKNTRRIRQPGPTHIISYILKTCFTSIFK